METSGKLVDFFFGGRGGEGYKPVSVDHACWPRITRPDIHGIVGKSSLNVGGHTVAGSEVSSLMEHLQLLRPTWPSLGWWSRPGCVASGLCLLSSTHLYVIMF